MIELFVIETIQLFSPIDVGEKEIGNCAISPGSISNPFSDMVLYSSHSNSKALTTTTSEPELNNGRYNKLDSPIIVDEKEIGSNDMSNSPEVSGNP